MFKRNKMSSLKCHTTWRLTQYTDEMTQNNKWQSSWTLPEKNTDEKKLNSTER